MFNKSGGENVSIKYGMVAQLVDPHVVDNDKDEGGGAAYNRVKEGVILNAYFPDSLEFSGLVDGVLGDGRIGVNGLRCGKSFSILPCVGVRGGQ